MACGVIVLLARRAYINKNIKRSTSGRFHQGFVRPTERTPLSGCMCFQPFYDVSRIFLLVSKLPAKNIRLTS